MPATGRSTVLATAFTLLSVGPLSAQYVGHVTITGGTHAGTYDMKRPTCTIDSHNQIVLVDTGAVRRKEGLASIVVEPARFVLGLGAVASPTVTAVGFTKNDPSRLNGIGTLSLTYMYQNITFIAEFPGTAVEGSDSVKVQVHIACKGVVRLP